MVTIHLILHRLVQRALDATDDSASVGLTHLCSTVLRTGKFLWVLAKISDGFGVAVTLKTQLKVQIRFFQNFSLLCTIDGSKSEVICGSKLGKASRELCVRLSRDLDLEGLARV